MLYSPLQRSTVEIREARDRAVDDSTHSKGVAADWMQEILQPLKSPCATVVDENLDEVLHCVCAEDPLIRGALSTSLGGDSQWRGSPTKPDSANDRWTLRCSSSWGRMRRSSGIVRRN